MKRVLAIIIFMTLALGSFAYAGESELGTGEPSSWAVQFVDKLADSGIVAKRLPAYTSNITRLDFAVIAVSMCEELLGESIIPSTDKFKDLDEISLSDKEYIAKAKAIGITSGYPDGTFRPYNQINRQEIAVMFINALKGSNIMMPANANVKFDDENEISDWAKNSVNMLKEINIISGVGENRFDPTGTATVEAAIIMTVKSLDNNKVSWDKRTKVNLFEEYKYHTKIDDNLYFVTDTPMFAYIGFGRMTDINITFVTNNTVAKYKMVNKYGEEMKYRLTGYEMAKVDFVSEDTIHLNNLIDENMSRLIDGNRRMSTLSITDDNNTDLGKNINVEYYRESSKLGVNEPNSKYLNGKETYEDITYTLILPEAFTIGAKSISNTLPKYEILIFSTEAKFGGQLSTDGKIIDSSYKVSDEATKVFKSKYTSFNKGDFIDIVYVFKIEGKYTELWIGGSLMADKALQYGIPSVVGGEVHLEYTNMYDNNSDTLMNIGN